MWLTDIDHRRGKASVSVGEDTWKLTRVYLLCLNSLFKTS